ncbi:polar flagellar hook-length control FliK domain protein, partial [Vibrio parahaemolyticus V-223/04]
MRWWRIISTQQFKWLLMVK